MFRLLTISVFIACLTWVDVSMGGEAPDGEASIEDRPYLVGLEENEAHKCTATLITSKMVLTSAYCTQGKAVANLRVRAGTAKKESGGETATVVKICDNPLYDDKSKDYDVSVLLLSQDFNLNEKIQPVALYPRDEEELPAETAGVVVGWDMLTKNSRLEQVSVAKLGDDDCRNAYADLVVNGRMTCFYKAHEECQGDYGSPLMVDKRQLGILSWGSKGVCGGAKTPGVYTDLTNPDIAKYVQGCVETLPETKS